MALTAGLAVALVLSACVDGPGPSAAEAPALEEPRGDETTLSLVAGDRAAGELAVDLWFTADAERPGPRMMELRVLLAGGLVYARSERLEAATAAGKDLIVRPQDDGTLRVVLFATTNTNRLQSGPLARLWFTPAAGGAAGGQVSLVERRPIFAPPEADLGVTLSAPVTLGGAR